MSETPNANDNPDLTDVYSYPVSDNEEAGMFIFPHGILAFANEYDAEVVQVLADSICYYHRQSKTWKYLDDVEKETRPRTLRPVN